MGGNDDDKYLLLSVWECEIISAMFYIVYYEIYSHNKVTKQGIYFEIVKGIAKIFNCQTLIFGPFILAI